MLAVDTIQSQTAFKQQRGNAFSSLFKSSRANILPESAISSSKTNKQLPLPPRNTSLPSVVISNNNNSNNNEPMAINPRPKQSQPAVTTLNRSQKPIAKSLSQDIQIDKWVTRIFAIITKGPPGGFVSYAISPQNQLYVDRTGNRASVDEVVSDLLPKDSCRYVAYKLRYQRDEAEKLRIVWFMWTPGEASKEAARYIQGLAGALIGLNSSSSIPIIEGKTTTDLTESKVMAQV